MIKSSGYSPDYTVELITRWFSYLYFKVLLTTTTGCKDLGVYNKPTRVFIVTQQDT
jgi:hypothetical protein